MSAADFKHAIAQALVARSRIRLLSEREVPRSFKAESGHVVLTRHTFRPGFWRVHYLDGSQSPVTSADASTYLEGLYLSLLAGADLAFATELRPVLAGGTHAKAG